MLDKDRKTTVALSVFHVKASRDEVYNTTLQLLRLVIVNELRHQKFDSLHTFICVLFDYFCPLFTTIPLEC